jgi:glycerol-3-phosphate dehydrogenase subunit C
VTTEYPGCCGMPYLEQGNLAKVAEQAAKVAAALRPLVDAGKDIITLTASCGLMFKFEWPLIVPDNEDVKALSAATRDISEYVVNIANKEGLAEGLVAPNGGPEKIAMHLACHARAQNVGPKSAEMLRFIPQAEVSVVERCSGHGGTFGVMKETRHLAVKVGKTAARNVAKAEADTVCSDCPLAAKHLVQLVEDIDEKTPPEAKHPIEVFASAYQLV